MVKETFRKNEIDIAVIPGGLTSKLQPLDVMINHSFKAKVCKLFVLLSQYTIPHSYYF
jgi:predicted amino acid dehydrogenase